MSRTSVIGTYEAVYGFSAGVEFVNDSAITVVSQVTDLGDGVYELVLEDRDGATDEVIHLTETWLEGQ